MGTEDCAVCGATLCPAHDVACRVAGDAICENVLEESLMRAALYALVSTLAGQNPEMQLAELREYCARRGWDIVGEYVDAGISGARSADQNSIACWLRVSGAKSMQLWSIAMTVSPAACASW